MEMRDALSSGFRQIAGFIFGKNVPPGAEVTGEGKKSTISMTSPVTLEAAAPTKTKISMTSPVTAELADEASSTYKVTFIMPSNYTMQTLPRPKNEAVKIVEVPARTMAATAWRGGSPSEAATHAKAAELRAELENAGWAAKGSMHLWQYHPPFAPAWMRRNEVLFEVEEVAAAATATS